MHSRRKGLEPITYVQIYGSATCLKCIIKWLEAEVSKQTKNGKKSKKALKLSMKLAALIREFERR